MAKTRDFGSLEQALQHALKDLDDEDLKATKKKREEFRKYSDPDKREYKLAHIDSVDIDVAMMKKGKGTPLLNAHEALVEKALEGSNTKDSVTRSLITMVSRIGRLTDETERAMDPNSPGGETLTKQEKDKIYKAIQEVEAKIAVFKKAIE